MRASQLLSLAFRNVRRNRRRSLVTIAAVIIGVAMSTIMRGFIEGAQTVIIEDAVEGRSGAIQVHKRGYLDSAEADPTKLAIPHSPELLEKMRSVPGVRAVAARLRFNGLVSNGVSQTLFVGRGVDLEAEPKVCSRSSVTVKEGGAELGPGDGAHALLGFELAQGFGLSVAPGAELPMVTLQSSSPEGRSNAVDVRVKGLTVSTLPFENKRTASIPLATAQALLGMEGRVTEYAVAVNRLAEVDQVAASLRKVLGDEYEVHTWKEVVPFVRDVVNRQNFIFASIAFVLFVIVLTGIINTMLMSVFERVREIGTMLAVGTKRRLVLWLFVAEAGVLGIGGGVVGAAIGFTVARLVALKGIPLQFSGSSGQALLRPQVPLGYVGMAVLIASVCALLAAAYPAYRASRMNPVDALRSV